MFQDDTNNKESKKQNKTKQNFTKSDLVTYGKTKDVQYKTSVLDISKKLEQLYKILFV